MAKCRAAQAGRHHPEEQGLKLTWYEPHGAQRHWPVGIIQKNKD